MRISAVQVSGFRGIQSLTVPFESGVTVLVGENGTGKSTVGTAISRLLSGTNSGLSNVLVREDWPYGRAGPLAITARLSLSQSEIETYLVRPLVPPAAKPDEANEVATWLRSFGDDIELSLQATAASTQTVTSMKWGGLHIKANRLAAYPIDIQDGGQEWYSIALSTAHTALSGQTLANFWKTQALLGHSPGNNLMGIMGDFLRGHFKLVPEFRGRGNPGSRSGAMEAWSGSDVASTLLNLRNHRERTERLRYDQIVQLFSLLVPRYKVEAVESQPGSPVPEILFYEKGQAEPISLEAVSAGLHQILAWVSSLVGRRDLVVFVEHPEEHLHPHSIRFLRKLLSDNSADNQIILTTHTPYAIDPLFPESLRRFWWGSQGSSCRWIDRTSVADPDYGRMRRALRSVGDREMVFSRAVVLTEEETTQQFLLGVAPTHEMNLDADGVSVISVGGDAGFKPYRTLLDGLGIPYVCQRDRSWGQHPDYPPDRYFALDSPGFEAFMDGQGFLALRREVEMEVGTSKPRVAGELASRLTKDQVPSVFVQVLTTAVALAKSA